MPIESGNDTILVVTHLPDTASAEKLAEILIASRLATCVNTIASCTSMYQWQGKLETAIELPMLIKTICNLYQALEAAILNIIPRNSLKSFGSLLKLPYPPYFEWVFAINV